MMSVGSNFLCERPHGTEPPPPSACVHLSLTSPHGRHKWIAPSESDL